MTRIVQAERRLAACEPGETRVCSSIIVDTTDEVR